MSNNSDNTGIHLEAGYEFPTAYYRLDESTVKAYLSAVEESSDLYKKTDLVPPTAVAALAMAALSKSAQFPPGCIHTSQKMDFKRAVHIGDTIQCHSRISQSKKRAGMHLITVTFHIEEQNKNQVLDGETVFIAPPEISNTVI